MNPFEDLSLLAAAFVASLFGQGGGILYTPVQVWSGVGVHTAATTSLFLILIMSLSSTLVFRREHKVDWTMALALESPTMLGAFCGGIISDYVSARNLALLLCGLLVAAAWLMIRPPNRRRLDGPSVRPGRWILHRGDADRPYHLDLRWVIPVMLPVGILTSMIGIGGGILKVPLMVLLFGVPMSVAVGSSAFMVGLTAVAGLFGHISMGHLEWQAALLPAVPVFIGAQIGARLSVRLDTLRMRKWFGVFVLLVALYTIRHTFSF